MTLTKFVDKTGRLLELRRLDDTHFYEVQAFYADGIEGLENKAFFKNFTEIELAEALGEHGGFFVGVYDADDRLVALSAIGFDADYGEGMRANFVALATNPDVQCLEYSGVFVLESHRRAGIAGFVMSYLIDYARESLAPCYLCGAVQHGNTASAANFLAHGFVFAGNKPQDETYNFDYFVLGIGT